MASVPLVVQVRAHEVIWESDGNLIMVVEGYADGGTVVAWCVVDPRDYEGSGE